MEAALEVRGVTAGYRSVPVLRDVSFGVSAGQVFGLVGPNGAGKSTLLDVICGELRPTAGRVLLLGQDVTRLPVHRRARLGLGRTFQRLEPFSSLGVADNLLAAAESGLPTTWEEPESARPASPSDASLPGTTAPAEIVHALLRRFGLVDFADHPLALAPTGVARLVEIARALAAGARVLLLDEPSSGMSEAQVREFARTVVALRADGLALLLVEHDAWLVGAVCDAVYRLDRAAAAGGLSPAAGSRPAPSTSG